MNPFPIIGAIVVIIIVIIALIAILFMLGYVKAPPDMAFIISGYKKKARFAIGKATIRIPFFERLDKLNLRLIPIDVKKSRGSLDSLNKFKEHNKLFAAIKISENNFGYDDNNKILTIPFYYVPFLINALQKGEFNQLINGTKTCN